MGGYLGIEVDDRQAHDSLVRQIRRLKKLKAGVFPRVINDSLTQVARDSAAEIRKKGSQALRVSKTVLKHRVFHRASTLKRMSALVIVQKKNIPVMQLNTRGSATRFDIGSGRRPVSRLKGVSIGSGINKRFYRNAFFSQPKKGRRAVKGSVQVLQRKGKARYPLDFPVVEVEKKLVPISKRVVRQVHARKFPRIFKQQLNRRINELERK